MEGQTVENAHTQPRVPRILQSTDRQIVGLTDTHILINADKWHLKIGALEVAELYEKFSSGYS